MKIMILKVAHIKMADRKHPMQIVETDKGVFIDNSHINPCPDKKWNPINYKDKEGKKIEANITDLYGNMISDIDTCTEEMWIKAVVPRMI